MSMSSAGNACNIRSREVASLGVDQMGEQEPTVILETVQADVATGVDMTGQDEHHLGRSERGAGGEVDVQEEDCRLVGTEAKKVLDIETSLDSWMIQCLDDVNALLSLRQSVTQALREGWMEISRARYAMGPNRMSYPLFSLRPCAASTCVALSGDLRDGDSGSEDADNAPGTDGGISEPANLSFKLLKGNGHNVHSSQDMDLPSQPASMSQLRRRTTYKANGGNGSLDLPLEDLILSDHADSDDEIALPPSKGNGQHQAPLYMFGALVSPDIRSAQKLFLKAVELVIEMANTQTSIVHTHHKVMELQDMLAQSNQNN